MKRKILPVLCLSLLILASCGRSEVGVSPFEQLAQKFQKELVLPVEPVESPSFLILPDAELVYGLSTAGFKVASVLPEESALARYQELVDERILDGMAILEKVSQDYSINPRLLLTVLEYQAGGLSNKEAALDEYSFIQDDPARKGLFRQLSWLANELNRGFYSRRVGGLRRFSTRDGVEVITSSQPNDATAAIQYALGKMLGYHDWQVAVGPLGISAQYAALFGGPGEFSEFKPTLDQPGLILPFSEGEGSSSVSHEGSSSVSHEGWFFTGGPHSAWGDGAAWAALDFAPDEEGFGCYDSDAWVLAAADGLIVRSEDGIVVQDLDGDGFMGTGWTILYMHIAERDRIDAGAFLTAGERIGHPSCEGGPSTGVHLHLARRYNGEWIPADQEVPFVLSGWVSSGAGVEYDGTLNREGRMVEASGFPTDENKILR